MGLESFREGCGHSALRESACEDCQLIARRPGTASSWIEAGTDPAVPPGEAPALLSAPGATFGTLTSEAGPDHLFKLQAGSLWGRAAPLPQVQ